MPTMPNIKLDSMWKVASGTAVAVGGTALVAKALFRPVTNAKKREWETGRRECFEPFRKTEEYYLSRGVEVTETYAKNSRRVEIFQKEWLPANWRNDGIKAMIFLCHGYADTCTYLLDEMAIRLAENGYGVFGMDYEGHGLTQGLHAYIYKFQQIVDDVIEHFLAVKQRSEFKGIKCFLYGESMGGAVTIMAHLTKPAEFDGAVLLSPMCKIGKEVQPPAVVVGLIRKLAFVFPKWQVVPQKNLLDIMFRDPEKKEKAAINPVGYESKPRLKTSIELLNVTEQIGNRMEEISLPFIVLHGGADQVTDPNFSRELHTRAGSKDKSIKIYDGAWHALFEGEPKDVAEVVMADILEWLDSKSVMVGPY